MQSVLERGADFRFQAAGVSMTPFIRDRDILTITGRDKQAPRTGDVVALIHPGGKLIVHRIVGRARTGFFIKGDNCRQSDGIFYTEAIAGRVITIERAGRRIHFSLGPEKYLIAFLSRIGLLNNLLLPILRSLKNYIKPN